MLILNINLRHSNLFPSQTELKVNGHHHIHMSDSKSSDILSDGPVKYILRPVDRPASIRGIFIFHLVIDVGSTLLKEVPVK